MVTSRFTTRLPGATSEGRLVRRPSKSSGASEPGGSGAPAGHECYRFDGWTLDITARELKGSGKDAIELTTAEFNLLDLFIRRPARVLSRDTIMDLLKGHDWSPLDRSIDTLVGRLRRKIEPDSENPTLIKTVRGVGYVFTADVVVV